jgi:hypothetical protein
MPKTVVSPTDFAPCLGVSNAQGWCTLLACAVGLGLFDPISARAQSGPPGNGPIAGVSFSNLTGTNGAPYLGSSEGGFAITPTVGNWYQGMIYGGPAPSIFDGPVNAPGVAVLQITAGVIPFTLSSLDFSSNNGDSTYDIQGFLGPTLQFHETGTMLGVFGPFHFTTLLSENPAVPIDGLLIQVIPGAGVTSLNLDNINVVFVPEPGSCVLLALGAAGWLSRRGVRRFSAAAR